jgi:hypothetical protein
MLTVLSVTAGPGRLAANSSAIPSQDHPVRIHPLHIRAAEQRVGRLVKADGDLGLPAPQILSRAQVERNARPTPVVDLQLAGKERLGARVRGDVRLLAIGAHRPAEDGAGVVLAAHRVLSPDFSN